MATHKITASDDTPRKAKAKVEKVAKDAKLEVVEAVEKAVKAPKTPKLPKADKPKSSVPAVLRPFVALGVYFKGAWFELRQVRWPNRKATWGLTIAVILFSLFLGVLILLLDAGYKFLFQIILK